MTNTIPELVESVSLTSVLHNEFREQVHYSQDIISRTGPLSSRERWCLTVDRFGALKLFCAFLNEINREHLGSVIVAL